MCYVNEPYLGQISITLCAHFNLTHTYIKYFCTSNKWLPLYGLLTSWGWKSYMISSGHGWVCQCVTLFLRIHLLTCSWNFLWNLGLNRQKNSWSRLLKKNYKVICGQKLSKIGHFGLKMLKNKDFCIFVKIHSLKWANVSYLNCSFS